MKKIIFIFLIIIMIFITVYKCFNLEEKILKHFYPIKYEEYIYKYSKKLDIDPFLALAIIKTESNFVEDCISRSGAIGLMQIMEDTAKEQTEKMGITYYEGMLKNPEENIKIGLNYFKSLSKYFNENYVLAFAAYNAGIGNVDKWIDEGIITKEGKNTQNIPFKETNMYVRKIIGNYTIYKELYSKRAT